MNRCLSQQLHCTLAAALNPVLILFFFFHLIEAPGGSPGRRHGGVPHGGSGGGHLDRVQLWFHSPSLPHGDLGAPARHKHRHTCSQSPTW